MRSALKAQSLKFECRMLHNDGCQSLKPPTPMVCRHARELDDTNLQTACNLASQITAIAPTEADIKAIIPRHLICFVICCISLLFCNPTPSLYFSYSATFCSSFLFCNPPPYSATPLPLFSS